MADSGSISSPYVTANSVLARYRFFTDVQLWPLETHLDPSGWLNNFTDADEKRHAFHLLAAFTYICDSMVKRLFVATFHALSKLVVPSESKKTVIAARSEWGRFLSRVVIVRVTGEIPHDADSGFQFTRMARDSLGIPEDRIIQHDQVLELLLKDTSQPVVFVDDFVGSGHQFVTMWQREYRVPGVGNLSFAMLSQLLKDAAIYYIPLICTSKGRETIERGCPQVNLLPAHYLTPEYSAIHPSSIVWPEELRITGPEFIKNISLRLGIPELGGDVGDWRGFHKLGLSLSFQHGTPDATLPLFSFTDRGWHPLVRRV